MVYSPPPRRSERERETEGKREDPRRDDIFSTPTPTTKWPDRSLNIVKYIPLGGSCIQYGGGSTRSVQYGTIYFMETGYWLYAPDSPLLYTHTLILIRHYLTVHK